MSEPEVQNSVRADLLALRFAPVYGAVPDGCWVHFSSIAMGGFRQLAAEQHVWFRAEAAERDGFSFRAVKVWTEDVEPASPPRSKRSSGGAYQSRLVLAFDELEGAGELDNE